MWASGHGFQVLLWILKEVIQLCMAGTVNANGISMGGNNGLYFNGNPDNGTITFNALGESELDVNFTGGGYSIILPPSGNVGIGSSNPAQILMSTALRA